MILLDGLKLRVTLDNVNGADERVYDFRERIQTLTNVPPLRQKLVGLTKGKLSSELDSTRFGTLGVKKGLVKFTMIGTPEGLDFRDPDRVILPEVRLWAFNPGSDLIPHCEVQVYPDVLQ